jgi:uncharacterized protein YciI
MDNFSREDRRSLYFYFNRNEPEKLRQAVPQHVHYWQAANLKGYMGGPFADRTGGLISFVASSLAEAEAVIRQDPFILENLIDRKWIKEWIVETHTPVGSRGD